MPSWNAYKVFASGKRAKMPYTTFEAEEAQHFFDNILPSLGAKLKKSKWLVWNSEEPQEGRSVPFYDKRDRMEMGLVYCSMR